MTYNRKPTASKVGPKGSRKTGKSQKPASVARYARKVKRLQLELAQLLERVVALEQGASCQWHTAEKTIN